MKEKGNEGFTCRGQGEGYGMKAGRAPAELGRRRGRECEPNRREEGDDKFGPLFHDGPERARISYLVGLTLDACGL